MMDWIAVLTEQGGLAEHAARTVPAALSDPMLTIAQASEIYRIVERGAQAFDRIVDAMEDDENVSDEMLEAAETVEDVWSRLSVAAANKLRTMQGLSPIEMPDDDD